MFTAAGCHGRPGCASPLKHCSFVSTDSVPPTRCSPPPWEVTATRTQTTILPSEQRMPHTCSPGWPLFRATPFWLERGVVPSLFLHSSQSLTLGVSVPCSILAQYKCSHPSPLKVHLAETAPYCLELVLPRCSNHWLASYWGQLLPSLWKVEIAKSCCSEILR